ncbi:MAG: hypothetical protein IPK26_10965 [Planctomycetes bacterium]|nr:hypothetical protein [Planctomycetota bacterium]
MNTATTELCPDSAAAARQLGALRTELDLLEGGIVKLDAELVDVEFPAHLGDVEAVKRRKDLMSSRAAVERRIADVKRAITSGEVHVRRLADAEREADRLEWAARADALRDQQLAAARRVDAALKELEAAHAAYLDAAGERGTAVRKAGGTWSNGAIVSHLHRAMHALCPRIATHVHLDRAQRVNAVPLEQMVR